jgi:hypothetical protein
MCMGQWDRCLDSVPHLPHNEHPFLNTRVPTLHHHIRLINKGNHEICPVQCRDLKKSRVG